VSALSFFVPGNPAPGGSKRAIPIYRGKKGAKVWTGKVAVIDSAGQRNKDWRSAVATVAFEAARDAQFKPLEGAVRLELHFKMPRPKAHFRAGHEIKLSAPKLHTIRPDAGKLARSTTDALTGILWRDDSQIAQEYVTKVYSSQIGCHVTVIELDSDSEATKIP
jgi:Holliday junction resolvase RusA-like endonuclease